MAKKNNNSLSYGQSPLPTAKKAYRTTLLSFGGLDKRGFHDSGMLSTAIGIDETKLPILETEKVYTDFNHIFYPDTVMSLHGFDNMLFVVVKSVQVQKVFIYEFIFDDDGTYKMYTGLLHDENKALSTVEATSEDEDGEYIEKEPKFNPYSDKNDRSFVKFNVYDTPTDVISGKFIKKVIILPDRVSFNYNIKEVDTIPEDVEEHITYYIPSSSVDSTTGLNTDGYTSGYYEFKTSNMKTYSTFEKLESRYVGAELPGLVGFIYQAKDENGNKKFYEVEEYEYEVGGEVKTGYRWTQIKGRTYFSCSKLYKDIIKYKNDTARDGLYPPSSDADTECIYYNTSTKITNESDRYYAWERYKHGDILTFGWRIASYVPNFPKMDYGTAFQSRLFGVGSGRVYASGFNDYSSWALDTISEYNESGAWCAVIQSDVKADGEFTAITSFGDSVIAFKKDKMYEIYGRTNPFRARSIASIGTIDVRTVKECGGNLIFVSEHGVHLFDGSSLHTISEELNTSSYVNAVSGSDERSYYLYVNHGGEHKIYIFDTLNGMWSERTAVSQILGMTSIGKRMFFLQRRASDNAGWIFERTRGHDGSGMTSNWLIETDIKTSKTSDIKHIKKLQINAYRENEIFGQTEYGVQNFKIYILYDDEVFNENTSHLVFSGAFNGYKVIRVKPRRTAHWGIRLHIEGNGYCRFNSIELLIEGGGGLYV